MFPRTLLPSPRVLLVCACAAALASASFAQNWTLSQSAATGSSPLSLASGDFNGDGMTDLAVGEAASVVFLQGKGNGNFQAPVTLSTPMGGEALAAGAFVSGDPAGIIVVGNGATASNNALLILNQGGSETVQSPFSLPYGSASSVTTADFGNGSIGFAVTFQQANKVAIFLGNGNGTFQSPKIYPTGVSPTWVAVGNFGGHGDRDLAITNSGDDSVTILLSNGDGTFTAAPTVPATSSVAGSQPISVVTGDFTGDGTVDLAVLKNGIDTILVFPGKGGGAFGTPTVFPVGQGNTGITAGDFTGSGYLDIAVVGPQSAVAVFINDGRGDFAPGNPPLPGNGPTALLAANLNGPGGSGLAVANGGDDSLSIFVTHPTGSQPTPTPTPTPAPTPTPTGGSGPGSGSGSARLVNLSTRAGVGTGANILIPGFVVSGSGTETLLIRADGPALAQFGVGGVLAQPTLSVYSGSTVIAANTGWGTSPNPALLTSTAAQVGAFAFAAGSADCAVIVTLSAGSYTVQISGANGTTGVALAEVYEVSTTGARLINISTRAQVGTGGNILIPGFVISGTGTEELLVRGDGPSLGQFGVSGVLAQVMLGVFNATTMIASNTGWGTSANPSQLASVAAQVGAFAFAANSADSAQIINLSAGSYTAQISGANGNTGVALAEIYEVH